MNTLKYNIISNPFKDQEYSKYDYIGQFITNGTKTLDDSASTIVVGRPHIDAAFETLIVGLLFEVISEEIADNYRCSIGGIAFASAISGSFPAANSAFSEDNELYVAVTIGDPLRTTVAALVPEKDTTETSKVVINNVEDKSSHEVGVIHGTSTAIVTGRNLSASLTGESIVLADLDTFVIKSTGTVTAQDGLGQRLEVNFAAPFAAGKYWLVLNTRGYSTPDAEVAAYRKKVSALAATLPAVTFTKIHPIGSTETDVIRVGQGFVCEGTLLTGATAKVKYYTAGSEEEVILDVPATDLTITETSVTVSQNWVEGEMPAVSSNKPVTVTLTASGVTVSHDAQFLYPV